MDAFARWLARKPYRATIINIAMLTAVLTLAGSEALFNTVGGGAIAIAGLYFMALAIGVSVRSRASATLYDIALIWLPGLLAICLGTTGLLLATAGQPLSLGHVLGVILFGCEMAMLVIASADLNEPRAPFERAEAV